jgi:sugar phosphate isomerase/epimerase
MLLGYNTNGLAHHDPLEAIELLADIGYRSVAITLDHGRLNPFAAGFERELSQTRRLLERRGMRSVIETGARFLLDPRVKHEPTLVTPDAAGRRRRLDFYRRAVLAAAALESDCVSIWSGVTHGAEHEDVVWDRLRAGLEELLDFAAELRVTIAFEPEPGMFIDTQRRWAELIERTPRSELRLTLDIGHLHCQGETPLADQIIRWGDRLANVHLEDMRAGVHEHLMFGEGEIEFPPVFAALAAAGYQGGAHVELSRHSHDGPNAARRAYEFLRFG